MSLDAKVSALTASLRSEFWKAWQETAEPAPYESFTTTLGSTTKIENFINATPVPGMTEWMGHRNYGKVDSFLYQIRNKTYNNGIIATLEDIEDDQVGILTSKPKELVVRAKKFPGRAVLKLLSQGTSTLCFDGTNFFAASHSFGSGNNLLTYTSSGSSDAATYNLVALYYGESMLKPCIWQNRSGPDFETNAGTPQSKEARQVRWWCDLRGAPAFGYWWHAILVQITNTPNVADMHTIFSNIEVQFRTFQLPKTISTEDGEYVHEQTVFNSDNLYLASSTGLSEVLRQALSQDWVPQTIGGGQGSGGGTAQTVATTNNFKGWAKYLVSVFLN